MGRFQGRTRMAPPVINPATKRSRGVGCATKRKSRLSLRERAIFRGAKDDTESSTALGAPASLCCRVNSRDVEEAFSATHRVRDPAKVREAAVGQSHGEEETAG